MRTRAQIDVVEIAPQDLILSKAQIQPDCCERLAQLAGERALIAQNPHLHELLRYCAAALDDSARLHIVMQRAQDSQRVNSKVAVKASVLNAEDSFHQLIREIRARGVCELERPDPPKRVSVCGFEYERRLGPIAG